MSIVIKSRPARRLALLAALALLASLSLPASSFAQATRTWVSGVGDDANPCSRVAPCKTFAGAISKTAAGGEIDALDPGGYGALTITKAITIDGGGGQVASILVSGTPGITVAAQPFDRVIIRNMRFDGLMGGTSTPGTNGIRIVSGYSTRIENSTIFGFGQSGVDFEANNSPQPKLIISNTTISANSNGVTAIPGGGTGEHMTIENSHIDDNNNCGLVVGGGCGVTSGSGTPTLANTVNTTFNGNASVGIESVGNSAVVIAKDAVFDNGTGLYHPGGGQIVSFGDNYVGSNGSDGTSTASVAARARDLGRIWRGLVARVREHKFVVQRRGHRH
jgi:hypothetical protein